MLRSARMMLAKEQSITIPLLGFNIGLELGQITMVLVILIIFTLVTKFKKLNQTEWLLITSSAAGAVALQMALERWPV
ncbi:MAG: hypothetical protein EOO18_12875 [Chryseobacterium sp.]|nr:MAG: hypothetical protein EOO18_12875 [Chryseobacterium sp.]